jgi:hypothetical protein
VGREIGNRVQEIWLAIVGRYQIKQELYWTPSKRFKYQNKLNEHLIL